jgi:hypothetical protein
MVTCQVMLSVMPQMMAANDADVRPGLMGDVTPELIVQSTLGLSGTDSA